MAPSPLRSTSAPLALFALLLTGIALAQDPPAPGSEETPAPRQTALEDVPWQCRLGIRSARLSERIRIVDQVVLVPDLPTWLDEIGRWQPGAQWPVLLEDDRYTPLFVRRFQPRRLLRRTSVERPLPTDPELLRELVERTAVAAWGGEPGTDTLDSIYASIPWWTPPGIVATSYADPAWPAALALALGRGQLLRTLDGDFGRANSSLDPAGFARLENRITELFAGSGYTWNAAGDELDALTICRTIPVRTETPLPRSLRPDVPPPPQLGGRDPIAITDLVCRGPEGERWAVAGWVFGDSVRSIYMSMCSLFLERDRVLLVNAYGDQGNWQAYCVERAADRLLESEYEVVGAHDEGDATLGAWRRLTMGGPDADVLFLNTSGSSVQLNMSRDTRGTPRDVPALSRPLALHMIHSFSLHSPESITTIGGRWLERGVYAYVGSCDEPYLAAFTPPLAIANRLASFTPFLVASRIDVGPMMKPWRVVTIGDPLMLIEPPDRLQRRGLDAFPEPAEGSRDLRTETLAALKAAMEEPGRTVDASVLESLHLLGQDALALKLWEAMRVNEIEDDLTPRAARAMLPVLFATRNATDYLNAYRLAGEPAGDPREMLWTLWAPRLASLRSAADLALFERADRPTQMACDLQLILPGLVRGGGDAAWNAVVARAMDRAGNDYDRMRLRALLK